MKYWIARHDPQRAFFLWQLNKWCKYIGPIKIQRYPMGNFWSRMHFRIFIWNAKIFSQQWLVLISILKKLSSFGYLPGRILCNFFAKPFPCLLLCLLPSFPCTSTKSKSKFCRMRENLFAFSGEWRQTRDKRKASVKRGLRARWASDDTINLKQGENFSCSESTTRHFST